MRVATLFCFLGLFVVNSVVGTSTCGKHEHLVSCYPCQPLCNGTVYPCPRYCTSPPRLCACDDGYCRKQLDGKCVKKLGVKTCGKHQHPVKCLPCSDLCNSTGIFCPHYCKETLSFCECNYGYCRKSDGNCVKKR